MAGYQLPARKLASQQDSAMIQRPDVPRSKFVGSFTRKTTFNAGLLIPFLVDEVLPGDHLKYDCTAYVRMATPYFPMMDNQRIDTHFFFVPNRLVWSNWKRFMGEQATPEQSIDLNIPTITWNAGSEIGVGSIWDYFGLPPTGSTQIIGGINVNALPFRAYNLIYSDWFRDENLIASPTLNVGDAVAFASTIGVNGFPFRRAKSQDYFTSALPWPQKFTAPSIQSAVSGLGIAAVDLAVYGGTTVVDTDSKPNNVAYANAYDTGTTPFWMKSDAATGYPAVYAEASVNSFRQAFLVQQLLERDARGGTRYTEIVRSHFGVVSPDARQQRPEYIGGGSSALNITPVAQTTGGAGAVGVLGAAATAVGKHMASYASTEHGYVIGLMSVRSELSYNQGIPRTFSRQTRYDFYWPSLAGLGEQAILEKEIYATGASSDDNVFGYQERWHEYRTRYSDVTGRFRTNVPNTLAAWHLTQNFASGPTLGQTFIQDNPPMPRVLAAGATAAEQHIEYLADILIQREAVRPLPMFGTPVTLGRF
ncbi:MAG: phage capsid protein [Betaproteobacteria bacterium]|jgi:hypothetical protein|nr:phage capsid protein [Betaproteobacteria bacterium]